MKILYLLILFSSHLWGQIVVTERLDFRLIPYLEEKDSIALKAVLSTLDYQSIPNIIKDLEEREQKYIIKLMVHQRSKKEVEFFDFMAKNLIKYDLLFQFPNSNNPDDNNEPVIRSDIKEFLSMYILNNGYLSNCDYFEKCKSEIRNNNHQNFYYNRAIGYFFKDHTADIHAKLEEKITVCEKANLLFILDAINHLKK